MPRSELSPAQQAFGRSLASHLKRKREDLELTTSEVAAKAGLSVDTIRALEAGRVPTPGFLTVHLVAKVLQLSLDDLATRSWRTPGRKRAAAPAGTGARKCAAPDKTRTGRRKK